MTLYNGHILNRESNMIKLELDDYAASLLRAVLKQARKEMDLIDAKLTSEDLTIIIRNLEAEIEKAEQLWELT